MLKPYIGVEEDSFFNKWVLGKSDLYIQKSEVKSSLCYWIYIYIMYIIDIQIFKKIVYYKTWNAETFGRKSREITSIYVGFILISGEHNSGK